MEANVTKPHDEDEEEQEEYVLLDLDGVSGIVDIPPNANYVLTGLDTLNPVLIIDNKLKLVGEYEETVGTCIAFTEQDTPVVHEETGPSDANLFSGTRIIDSSQPPTKEVKSLCQLHKVLKFKISPEPDSEIQGATSEEADGAQNVVAGPGSVIGPGMEMQKAGPGMEMQEAGPGMEMQEAGPGMQMQEAGPGMEMHEAGPGMVMQEAGPGMEMQEAGPGVEMQEAGPGVEMQEAGPGVEMQEVGPETRAQQEVHDRWGRVYVRKKQNAQREENG